MESIYLYSAAIGGTLIVCQFAMTLFGLGGGHDFGSADVSADIAGSLDASGHDVGHAHDSHWFIGLLTFRAISAALAFFGLAGVIGQRASFQPAFTLILAVSAAGAAIYFVGWIMKLIASLNIDGTVRIDRAMGCVGSVYLPIPGAKAGFGRVQINVMNRTMEYKAVSTNALPTGTRIIVMAVLGPDTVEVAQNQD